MKTTKKDFERFKKYFKRYAFDIMGLKNYEVKFKHEKLDKSYADITTGVGGQLSIVRFSTSIPYSTKRDKRYEIKRTAFHEACELMLARIQACATARYVTVNEIDEASHEIIRMLEHEWMTRIK